MIGLFRQKHRPFFSKTSTFFVENIDVFDGKDLSFSRGFVSSSIKVVTPNAIILAVSWFRWVLKLFHANLEEKNLPLKPLYL